MMGSGMKFMKICLTKRSKKEEDVSLQNIHYTKTELLNKEILPDGTESSITGSAYYQDDNEGGELTVDLDGTPSPAPYWVVELGPKKTKNKDVKTIPNDDFLLFFLKLKSETIKQSPNAKFIYLCADTHFYQYGFIKIKCKSGEYTDMEITQVIAGTGGTTLDIIPLNYDKIITKNIENKKTEYEIKSSIQQHGFVEIREKLQLDSRKSARVGLRRTSNYTPIGNGLEYRFHAVNPTSRISSTRRKRSTSRISSTRRKRSSSSAPTRRKSAP